MEKFAAWSRKALIILFWLVLWHVLSASIRNQILLVGPLDMLKSLYGLIFVPGFWQAIGFSFGRICLGFFLAFFLGLGTGALSFRFPFVGELLAPPIQFMKSIPVASFVILALIWTGARNLSVFIALIVVYPMIHINTLAGFSSTDKKLLEMAQIFRVPVWRKGFYLYRISLYPYLKSACRTALGMAFKSGIAAEVIGVPDGSIGEGLYLSKIYLSTAELFAWTFVIMIVSTIFEKVFLILLRLCAGKGVREHAAGI